MRGWLVIRDSIRDPQTLSSSSGTRVHSVSPSPPGYLVTTWIILRSRRSPLSETPTSYRRSALRALFTDGLYLELTSDGHSSTSLSSSTLCPTMRSVLLAVNVSTPSRKEKVENGVGILPIPWRLLPIATIVTRLEKSTPLSKLKGSLGTRL